jgi:hypothetical protein
MRAFARFSRLIAEPYAVGKLGNGLGPICPADYDGDGKTEEKFRWPADLPKFRLKLMMATDGPTLRSSETVLQNRTGDVSYKRFD